MRFSVGYELTETVRAAILQIPENAWVPALDQGGSAHKNGVSLTITLASRGQTAIREFTGRLASRRTSRRTQPSRSPGAPV